MEYRNLCRSRHFCLNSYTFNSIIYVMAWEQSTLPNHSPIRRTYNLSHTFPRRIHANRDTNQKCRRDKEQVLRFLKRYPPNFIALCALFLVSFLSFGKVVIRWNKRCPCLFSTATFIERIDCILDVGVIIIFSLVLGLGIWEGGRKMIDPLLTSYGKNENSEAKIWYIDELCQFYKLRCLWCKIHYDVEYTSRNLGINGMESNTEGWKDERMTQ